MSAEAFERCIAAGGVAVFPSDTVYGLACDVADVRLGQAPRRGIAELDGHGEVAGGIVVMRQWSVPIPRTAGHDRVPSVMG